MLPCARTALAQIARGQGIRTATTAPSLLARPRHASTSTSITRTTTTTATRPMPAQDPPVPEPSTQRATAFPAPSILDEAPPSSSSAAPAPLAALPGIPDGPGEAQQVQVNGAAVSLGHLGPVVVNVDGTMARIGNWAQMTDTERANTARVIAARNKRRLDAIKRRKKEEEKEKEKAELEGQGAAE